MQIITNSEKETFEFAKNFAKKLKGGEVIGLIGNLGAGKTIFTKGLAASLGVKQTVNSPTFVIMKIYPIPNDQSLMTNLIHIDAYRLNNEKELEAIGAREYFGRKDCITIIEWADKVKKVLPKKAIKINFEAEENKRKIKTAKFS